MILLLDLVVVLESFFFLAGANPCGIGRIICLSAPGPKKHLSHSFMFRLCCNFDNKSYELFDEWSYQMHNSCWNHQQAPWALNVVQNVCHFPDFLFFTALIFDLPDQILKLLKARERLIFWTIYDLIYSYSIISTTDNNNNILFFNETKKKLLFYYYYYHWVMGFYATCISGF